MVMFNGKYVEIIQKIVMRPAPNLSGRNLRKKKKLRNNNVCLFIAITYIEIVWCFINKIGSLCFPTITNMCERSTLSSALTIWVSLGKHELLLLHSFEVISYDVTIIIILLNSIYLMTSCYLSNIFHFCDCVL